MTARPHRSERGSAFVELALLFSVMMLLFAGVIDFALLIQQAMVISEAAYAGAEYGAQSGNSSNFSGMQTIAINSARGVSGLTATATKWCSCSAGGTAVSCSYVCPSYGTPIAYVQVVTAATPTVLMKFTGVPLTVPLTGICVLRVQ
jgi:Flp pilus assembly protein TadG